MANQSIGTPRFYLDFTQLAKAKGYVKAGETNTSINLNPINDDKNNNVWDYDYVNTTNYTAGTSQMAHFTFSMPAFWERSWQYVDDHLVKEWCKLMATSNYAGVINHNLHTAANGNSAFYLVPYFSSGVQHTWFPREGIVNSNGGIYKNGYSFVSFNSEDSEFAEHINNEEYQRFSQFRMQFSNNSGQTFAEDTNLDIGAITFGKYIDMPTAPDLKVSKSIVYDGFTKIRTMGGSDYVNINNQGCPDWLVGEPWTLKDETTSGRIGKNGRRRWDLKFSYIDSSDAFYATGQPTIGSHINIGSEGQESSFQSKSEVQQIWDLTLGGALSFVFCPDVSATNEDIEFAVCKLTTNSIKFNQIAYNAWNISIGVEEVW